MFKGHPKVTLGPSEKKYLKDKSGDVLEVVPVDGINFPAFMVESGMIPNPQTNIPKIKELEIRKDDIFICAYPKTGTNWMWEIVSMLTKGSSENEVKSKVTSELEFQAVEHLDSVPSPRVFNTHLLYRHMPNQTVENGAKIIFLQRNPKDVAVSSMFHIRNLPTPWKPEWDNFLPFFIGDEGMFPPFVEYTNDWEKNLREIPEENLLMLYYEDIKMNPVSEITKIAKFVGADWKNETFINTVVQKTSFSAMKSEKTKKTGDESIDKGRKFSGHIYRKGEIGDWKNYFTVAQNEMFDAYMHEAMKNSSFKYTYTPQQ